MVMSEYTESPGRYDYTVQYQQENIIGEFKKKTRYDLMSVVMICFNEKSWQKKISKLHGMLGTVFSEKLSAKEKEQILEEEYGIEAEREVKEGIRSMCNLSAGIEERCKQQSIIELICRKAKRNKPFVLIVDELEEDESTILPFYNAVMQTAPNYDAERAYEVLRNNRE